jgi:hypothetical protein
MDGLWAFLVVFTATSDIRGSNAQDLWIGLGLNAKGVPSRVID